jgi:hypothetical protein
MSMLRSLIALSLAALCAAPWLDAHAGKRTVCTITVNSTEERDAFRRHLPEKDFQFVELVERGRRDWLSSACKQQVQCDMLVISGHFNGNDFFSDQLQVDEHLPVVEMERASCSDSCPGLFSRLKEVYMFGCESLNGERMQGVSAEIARTLVNGGQSRAEAERVAQMLLDGHAESNRDVMRRVFVNTPAIYGFSSVAPVGATAGPILNRYLQASSSNEVGTGRPNHRLLAYFAAHSMSLATGLRDNEPRAAHRAEVCRFVDDRLTAPQKLGFVHGILQRDPAQARMFLDRIERFLASLNNDQRRAPAVAEALAQIARDDRSRERYLTYARNTDTASTRVRMTDVANSLGWLSDAEYRDETVKIVQDLTSPQRSISVADVDQVCKLNRKGDYDGVLSSLHRPERSTGQTAALACLGSPEDRDRMLLALASASERDIEMAEVYFHHRPIADVEELRVVTGSIVKLGKTDAQVRSLHALARQPIVDADGLDELARLFPVAESITVQRAIASVFIRSDHRAVATPELVRVFREHRKASSGNDVIDVLIRRLERAMAVAGAQALR